MKALYNTVLIIILGISNLYAQNLHFTDTSNRWKVHSIRPDDMSSMIYYTTWNSRLKDTVINEQHGFLFAEMSGTDLVSINQLFITEDTIAKKVFAKDFSIEDTSTFVLYDFMIEEGDSLYLPYWSYEEVTYQICTSVLPDVLVNGIPHRAFIMYDQCYEYTVIEGVGALTDPNYPYYRCAERGSIDLVCFENNGERPVFSAVFDNNCVIDIVDYHLLKSKLSLTPNPTSGWLHLSIPPTNVNFQFAIYNIIGRQVHQGVLKDQLTLDISTWQNGMYVVKLIDENGNTIAKRFVKQ